MLDSTSDEPIAINRDCVVQMLVMHVADLDDAPDYFVDLLGNPGADLTGRWRLENDYGHGTSVAEAELVQQDDVLTGMVIMDSTSGDQERWLVQQWVNGRVAADGSFEMHGWGLRIIDGPHDDYYLDSWYGEPVGAGIYEGYTLDAGGSQGSFVMTSIA